MKKSTHPNTGRRRLTFTLEAPDARQVSLVGDFNDWNPKRHPMKKNRNGQWQKAVMLQPGTYEYKFWTDEHWIVDSNNDNRCANKFGTMNNLVTVSPWPKKK